MTLSQNANGIDLVGKADKLLQLIQTTISSSKNSTLSSIGSMVANYEKVASLVVYPTEFEKTPKKSIKRYLYKI